VISAPIKWAERPSEMTTIMLTWETSAIYNVQFNEVRIHPSIIYLSKASKHIKRANQLKTYNIGFDAKAHVRAVRPLTRGP